MILISKISNLCKRIKKEKQKGRSVSFVPTMGAIHKGHLSLIKEARKRGDILVVSIFVNPTQFGPKEDLRKYPRSFLKDKKLLKENGVDILFYPTAKEMYPEGYSTYVTEEVLSKAMCGLSRPGHFRGVTTVVLKLFNIVQPDIAFFGRKDYQQAQIIKKMVKDLNLDVKIRVMPIVRDSDGLALSSRNKYLRPKEREKALNIYKTLKKKKKVKKIDGVKLEYFVALDKETLRPVKKLKKGTLLATAGKVGKTRLIDNIIMK